MKVLHLLASGGAGGIETLCEDFSKYSQNDNIFLFVWFGGCIAEEIKKQEGRVIELNASKKDILGPFCRILELLKQEQIEVIMVHHASPVMHLYAMWAKKLCRGVKVIVYAHGEAEIMCRVNIKKGLCVRKWIMREAVHRADGIVAISQSVKSSLVQYLGAKEEKIAVIYNGVDIQRFKSTFHQPQETVQIVYIGRLIAGKGVQNTLQILAMLPKQLKYRFSVVGDGAYRKTLEQLVGKLGLEGKVEFLGVRRDIPSILKSKDIFVHIPDLNEGFGITIVEAMAAGLVLFCGNSGAIPEIIENDKNGILVDKANKQKIAQELERIIQNISSEKVMKLRYQARERAEYFSITSFADNLDKFIYKIGRGI